MITPLEVQVVTLEGKNVRDLIAIHLSGMQNNSPEGSVYALDMSGLSADNITLFGVEIDGAIQAIGALKSLGSKAGEIKSMRTSQDYLGQGIGKLILRHIINQARERGYSKLSLETGSGEAFSAAIYLYQTHGFVPCSAFGEYESSDFNQFFELDLTSTPNL